MSASTDPTGTGVRAVVEILGHYNPRSRPAVVQIDKERVSYWISRGAQPSDSVRTLIARHLTPAAGVATPAGSAPATAAPAQAK